jgi:hypothetical protein
MSQLWIFFKPQAGVQLEPAAIARELVWGEDVEGLVDLPVRQIIDRLKDEFPQHTEKTGLVVLELSGGKAEATWSWQHLQVDVAAADEAERARLENVLAEFGCPVFKQS